MNRLFRLTFLLAIAVTNPVRAQDDAKPKDDKDRPPYMVETQDGKVVDKYTIPLPDPEQAEPPKDLEDVVKTDDAGRKVAEYSAYRDKHNREIKHGRYTTYFPNGQKWRECTYVHGHINGVDKWYYPSGRIRMEIRLRMSTRHGTATYFSPAGQVVKREKYIDGRLVDVQTYR